MLKSVIKRLEQKEIYVEVTDAAKEHMTREGFDPVYGARPLRRAIQRTLEDNLSEEIIAGRIKAGDKVLVDVENDKLIFKKHKCKGWVTSLLFIFCSFELYIYVWYN